MNTFIKSISIEKVRHLNNININLSDTNKKHLILTGKNGSGKTSFLEAIKSYLSMYENNYTYEELYNSIYNNEKRLSNPNNSDRNVLNLQSNLKFSINRFDNYTKGVKLDFDNEVAMLEKYQNGDFIYGYYSANRFYQPIEVKHVEKTELKDNYKIDEKAGNLFVKYLVDLKTTQSLAQTANKLERANQIKNWFDNFEKLLKNLFDDEQLILDFDIDTFQFNIQLSNREPFQFNQMSSGYSAIFEIISDLMIKMEKKSKGCYNMEGIVLIDEIDTHLHLDLQKKIFPFLTEFFPNIQFIVTTHSPFILNSSDNVVIYDLENNIEIQEGLKNIPYGGVVEGYFEVDTLSEELKSKFEKYKELASKTNLEDEDYILLAELEIYLDEIPDYLAFDISCEYERLKYELENRG